MSDPIIRAKNGHTDYFKLTPVEHWMKASEWGEEQYDALSVAIMNHHIHCAKVIYSRCPELLHRPSKTSKFTVLHHAVSRENNPSLIKFIISVADRKLYRMADIWQNTPFTMSIAHNRFHAFQLMAEADPDLLSYIDGKGLTPLLKVQECHGSDDSVSARFRKLILEKQPNSCQIPTGEHGWTALHHAASKGYLGAIQDIIRFCPDSVHVLDNQGNDFVDISITFQHSDVVKKVLRKRKIWDSILKVNNVQGIRKLETFLNVANPRNEREKELRIPPQHLGLYRELVNQFGEIVDPSKLIEEAPTSMCEALGCFLADVSKMADLQTGQEETISTWERMAARYSAMGLQVSWFQKLVARYRDWFAKTGDHLSHLEDEIATKEALFATKRDALEIKYNSEVKPLVEELEELHNVLDELKEQRDTYTTESDPLSVIWKIVHE